MMKLGIVIPVGPGRSENIALCLHHLAEQNKPIEHTVLVLDGPDVERPSLGDNMSVVQLREKHEPGQEQPRNIGVRRLMEADPLVTHVVFLDSDIIVGQTWSQSIGFAYTLDDDFQRVLVCPYDWMPPGRRTIMTTCRNDPRWPLFQSSPSDKLYRADLSAGLACFSGNLVWPVDQFLRVGGYWSEIHHGRCEDGELGLRAVSMGVPISFCASARGWHLWHPVDMKLVLARNERDVPMLNARHHWVQGAGVFLVDRDGAAFDVICPKCQEMVPTNGWWDHSQQCAVPINIPAEV